MTRTARISRRLAIVLASLIAPVAGAAGAERAAAMTPAQTTQGGVVGMLGGFQSGSHYGSIDDFWRRTLPAWGFGYAKPTIRYYGNGAGGYYGTACGSTAPWNGENGFYCPTTDTIHLDYWGQQGLLNRLGDHGSGGFLAHEWAHRAQHHMGTMVNDFRGEYNADCLAGLYTRFGYNTGRLNGSDFWEFSNWLAGQRTSISHGTGANRAAWFRYGYTQFSKAACDSAFTLTASGASARGAAGRKSVLAAARRLRPPVTTAVDVTPRKSQSLPRSGRRLSFPTHEQHAHTTPIG